MVGQVPAELGRNRAAMAVGIDVAPPVDPLGPIRTADGLAATPPPQQSAGRARRRMPICRRFYVSRPGREVGVPGQLWASRTLHRLRRWGCETMLRMGQSCIFLPSARQGIRSNFLRLLELT